MLGLRLVRMIEKHSAEIAEALMTKLLISERTRGYRNLPPEELRKALVTLYSHLGEWLLTKTERDIEEQFRAVGVRRASEGIPASQLAWALHMSKSQLWAFVYREGGAEKAIELYGELELLETLDRFFDYAIYCALTAYEERAQSQRAA